MGKHCLIEKVSKLAIELFVLIVADLQNSVFGAEGVAVIVAQIVAGELDGPAIQILAVEEAFPSAGV